MENVEIKRKVTLKEKKSISKPTRKFKWWFWIILLVIVIVPVFLLINKSSSKVKDTAIAPNNTTESVQTVSVENAKATSEGSKEKVIKNHAEKTIDKASNDIPNKSVRSNSTKVENSNNGSFQGNPSSDSSSKSVSQVSTLSQSTIEYKAKRVIAGDYGNGLDRKKALGVEYKAIQHKVNEMYRNGTF